MFKKQKTTIERLEQLDKVMIAKINSETSIVDHDRIEEYL